MPDDLKHLLKDFDDDDDRKHLEEQLAAAPKIWESLKLDAATLADGSKLYRQHCLHCHGLSGNGRGPTAPWGQPSSA